MHTGSVSSHGVHPREMAGLVGILLGPFLHAGIWHLIVNVLPFFVLGGLVMMRWVDERVFVSW